MVLDFSVISNISIYPWFQCKSFVSAKDVGVNNGRQIIASSYLHQRFTNFCFLDTAFVPSQLSIKEKITIL